MMIPTSLHRRVVVVAVTTSTPRQSQRRHISSKSTSWERNARMVKNTKDVSNKYVNHIRETHDPTLHIKTLEEEIRGTMGEALGRQGDKIQAALKAMQKERDSYDRLLEEEQHCPLWTKKLVECAKRHNANRKQAMTARWELIVHRQAVGMIVNNHKFVHDMFPIGDALPEEYNGGDETGLAKMKPEAPKKFGDQLDWWQSVGRWK